MTFDVEYKTAGDGLGRLKRPKICPKCHGRVGTDWSRCDGMCPMPMSPHYNTRAMDKIHASNKYLKQLRVCNFRGCKEDGHVDRGVSVTIRENPPEIHRLWFCCSEHAMGCLAERIAEKMK